MIPISDLEIILIGMEHLRDVQNRYSHSMVAFQKGLAFQVKVADEEIFYLKSLIKVRKKWDSIPGVRNVEG